VTGFEERRSVQPPARHGQWRLTQMTGFFGRSAIATSAIEPRQECNLARSADHVATGDSVAKTKRPKLFRAMDALSNSPPPSTAHRQNRCFHGSGKWHRRVSPAPPQSHSHWKLSGHMITRLAAEGRNDRGFSPNRCREVFRRQPKSALRESVGTRDQESNDPTSWTGLFADPIQTRQSKDLLRRMWVVQLA
jgi:hypothetical protein